MAKRARSISLPERMWRYLDRFGDTANSQILKDLKALQAIEAAAERSPDTTIGEIMELIYDAQNGVEQGGVE